MRENRKLRLQALPHTFQALPRRATLFYAPLGGRSYMSAKSSSSSTVPPAPLRSTSPAAVDAFSPNTASSNVERST